MSGKLLKICTAVMLVTGMGDVVCQGGDGAMDLEAGPSYSVKRKAEDYGWRDSVSASVKCEVRAIVKVKSDEDSKELRLFNADGTTTDESERTFEFKILSVGTKGTVTVKGGNGMEYVEQGKWNIFAEGYASTGRGVPYVTALLEMYDEFNNRVMLDDNNSASVDRRGNFSNEEKWKLILKPSPLNDKTESGTYRGNLNVTVSANG